MDKLIITAACDSRVSYPANHYCLPSTRENAVAIADEYVRCLDAGASIAHLHGIRALEAEIQEDGKKLSRLDVAGWQEMTQSIRDRTDGIIQYGIAGARLEDRVPLMKLGPDMMSVAFNSHDEYFQPDPSYPPNAIYSLHPLEELREYTKVTAEHGVKIEVESFHTGALWNLRRLQGEGLLPEPVWTTLFVDWDGGSWTPPEERALQFMVDSLPAGVNWNVSVMSPERHWNILAMAIGMGGHIRVGYEDNPYLSPGELADSNARLVDKAVQLATLLGREIASPDEAREIIGLHSRVPV
ncbi:3-keto-5-aminohexanoate cleavage protein [Kribbella sp. NPDC050124]|uniref:3-keto-5-aminohexanoate cleavage protein n=1 Tax=Kribbella sp. NPDC050124 TaxID=3364114 RepID=UPI0037A77E03